MGLETFGRYAIQAVIGEGGMGRVYRAHDPRLGRTVAVKVLRADATAEDATWLLREARLAAQLEHPNVVRVYDSGEVDGQPFIVMECVRGTSLRALATDETVSVERKLGWLLGVARALAAAHARGLVHRDVKPSNVMVGEEDDIARVLDFGIARHVGPTAIEGPTLTGRLVGTPQYMSPEQMRGEAVDGRTDQFAWGVMAYALLTGATPWKTADPRELAFAVLADDVGPFAERVPSLDPAVETIILRTLSKSAADRFPTTDLLVRALEDVTKRTALDAHPSDATVTTDGASVAAAGVSRERPQPRRRPSLSRVIALAAAAVGLVVARSRAPHQTSAADADRPVPVTDLPAPASSQEGAAVSYKMAMQAYRDGQPSRATKELEHALTRDPNLAAAHLRMATFLFTDTPGGSRDHLAQAIALRSALDAHDQQLLRALTPILQENPSDFAEAATRLRAAMISAPRDADFAFWLAVTEMYGREEGASPAAFNRVLALDPAFGPAHYGKIDWLLSLGRWDDASHAVDTCLAAVPASVLCLRGRASLERERGDCTALERDARQLVVMDRTDSLGWYWRAEAEQARGAGGAAVAEEVRKALARRAGSELGRPHGDYSRAVLAGDFGAAERSARDHLAAVFSFRAMGAHAQAARELVDVLAEQGDVAASATVAEKFLAQRDAWELDARGEALAIARDPVPVMLAVVLRGHRIDEATFARERDAWAAKWRARVSARYLPFVWAHGWAAPASTPAQAKEAIAALDHWGGHAPRFTEGTRLVQDIGRMYALAGSRDEAAEWLRAAASACTAIERPLAHVQAQYWLGRVSEDVGDHGAACSAFRAVAKAWGHAAHSVTADDAKAAAARLKCPP